MSKNLLDLTFGVQSPEGNVSSVWKVWVTKKSDVYACVKYLAGIHKFSFHASGICRMGFTSQHGAALGLDDRAMLKWRRAQTPLEGLGGGSRVMSIIFPVKYLSKPELTDTKNITWIKTKEEGCTEIEFIFTKEGDETVKSDFEVMGHRELLRHCALPNSENLLIAFSNKQCEMNDLLMPGKDGHKSFIFPQYDNKSSGRPVRLSLYTNPCDNDSIEVWEIGGYRIESEAEIQGEYNVFERNQILSENKR